MAVYDCFTFFNEIEQLKIRMKMLNPYVDYFVLCELKKTFRGEEKPLYFREHQKDFEDYKDKIIYICPDYVPEYKGTGDWTIESYQRNCLMHGLLQCKADDIILISDLDEIPNPKIFTANVKLSIFPNNTSRSCWRQLFGHMINIGSKEFRKKIIKNKSSDLRSILDYTMVACEQDFYYYYMNCKSKAKWHGTVIAKYKNMSIPQVMRDKRNTLPVLKNGGWHFSYLGGVDRIKSKLKSIIDSRDIVNKNMDKYSNDDEYIEYCMNNGIDILGREHDKEGQFYFIKPDEIGIDNIGLLMERYPDYFRIK